MPRIASVNPFYIIAPLAGTASILPALSRFAGSKLFVYGSIYLLWGMLFFWIVTMVRVARSADLSSLAQRKNRLRLAVTVFGAMALSTFIFLRISPQLRVLSDETNLLGVSRSLLNESSIYNHIQGTYEIDGFHPIETEIPSRPLLYPFLVYTIHLVRGFEIENAYLVNFYLLSFLIFICSTLGYVAGGMMSAFGAPLLIFFAPALLFSVTSAGFDLLCLTLFLSAFLILWKLQKKPDTNLFSFWIATLVLFANSRYESIVLAAMLVVGAYYFIPNLKKFYSIKNKSLAWTWSLAFVFISPLFQQALLKSHRDGNYNANRLTFSPEHLIFNLKSFGWMAILGIITLVFTLRRLIKIKNRYWLLVFMTFIFSQIIFLSFYAGDLDKRTQQRLFIQLQVACGMFPVLLLHLTRAPWLKPTIAALGIAGLIYGLGQADRLERHPYSVATEEIHAFQRYIVDQVRQPFLIISDRPGMYLTLGFSSLSFENAAALTPQIAEDLAKNTFTKIIAMQKYDARSNQPWKDNTLGENYMFHTELQAELVPGVQLKLNQIVPIK